MTTTTTTESLLAGTLLDGLAAGVFCGRLIRGNDIVPVLSEPRGALVATVPGQPSGAAPGNGSEPAASPVPAPPSQPRPPQQAPPPPASPAAASPAATGGGENSGGLELPPALTPQVAFAPGRIAADPLDGADPLPAPDVDPPRVGPAAAEPPTTVPGDLPPQEPASIELGATTTLSEVAVFVDPCTRPGVGGCPTGVLAQVGGTAAPPLRLVRTEVSASGFDRSYGECLRRFGPEASDDLYVVVVLSRPARGQLRATFHQGAGAAVELDIAPSDVAAARWERDVRLGSRHDVAHCARVPATTWKANANIPLICWSDCPWISEGTFDLDGVLSDGDGGRLTLVDEVVHLPTRGGCEEGQEERQAWVALTPLGANTLKVESVMLWWNGSITAAAFPAGTDCATWDPVRNSPAPVSTQFGRTHAEAIGNYRARFTAVLRLPEDRPSNVVYRLCVFRLDGRSSTPGDVDITRIEQHDIVPPAASRYRVRVVPRGGAALPAGYQLRFRLEYPDAEVNPTGWAGRLSTRCDLPNPNGPQIRPLDDPNLVCELSSRAIFGPDETEGTVLVSAGRVGQAPVTQAMRLSAQGCTGSHASCQQFDHPLVFPDALVIVSRRPGAADVPEDVVVPVRNEWTFNPFGPPLVRASNAVGERSAWPVLTSVNRALPTPDRVELRLAFDRDVTVVAAEAIPQSALAPRACRRPLTPQRGNPEDTTVLAAGGLCPGLVYSASVTVQMVANGARFTFASVPAAVTDAVLAAPCLTFRTPPSPAVPVTASVEVVSLPGGVAARGLVVRAEVNVDGRPVVGASGLTELLNGRAGSACRPLAGRLAESTAPLSLAGVRSVSVRLELHAQPTGSCVLGGGQRLIAEANTQVYIPADPDRALGVITVRGDGLVARVTLAPAAA